MNAIDCLRGSSLSQRQLSRLTGVPQATISRLMTGVATGLSPQAERAVLAAWTTVKTVEEGLLKLNSLRRQKADLTVQISDTEAEIDELIRIARTGRQP